MILKRYIDKYGVNELESVGLPGYQIPMILSQAMSQAGTVDDTLKVAETMRNGEWQTMFGKGRFVGTKTFGLPVVIEQPNFISKVQGGKLVTFDAPLGTMPWKSENAGRLGWTNPAGRTRAGLQ